MPSASSDDPSGESLSTTTVSTCSRSGGRSPRGTDRGCPARCSSRRRWSRRARPGAPEVRRAAASVPAMVTASPSSPFASLRAIDTRDRIHARAVSVVAGNRDRLPLRALRRIARSYLDMDAGRCFVPALNGEHRVLAIVGAEPARTVFDVGANVGEWTASALESFPSAQIHAFELVPDTAEELARRFRAEPRVVVNACGLDAEAAQIQVTYYPSFSEGSGVNDAHPGFEAETRAARVVTGDEYCRERGHRVRRLPEDRRGGRRAARARGLRRDARGARDQGHPVRVRPDQHRLPCLPGRPLRPPRRPRLRHRQDLPEARRLHALRRAPARGLPRAELHRGRRGHESLVAHLAGA